MAADKAKSAKSAGSAEESEVWSAIAAFEQILEAIPNDRTALETLAHACEQIGDLTRAKDYLIRLADVLIAERDSEAAAKLAEALAPYAAEDDTAKAAVARINASLAQKAALVQTDDSAAQEVRRAQSTDTSAKTAQAPSAQSVQTSFNIANELSFAWNLLQSNLLSQEEYSNVVQDLTEMSGKDSTVTVSVLHVLNDRGFKSLGRILATVSRECGTPIISLSNFDLQPAATGILPLEFVLGRGALVFELLGGDALAVVMNPYDKQLMNDTQALAKRKCHFFMTMPTEFDAAAHKLAAGAEEAAPAHPAKQKPPAGGASPAKKA